MIVVDTNVISEPTKQSGSEKVKQWLNNQSPETLYFTSISFGEVLAGLATLPVGKRQRELSASSSKLIEACFGQRILPYDREAAEFYAQIFVKSRAAGKPIGLVDAQIAAIAMSRGFAVATRDTLPFVTAGLEVINPWH